MLTGSKRIVTRWRGFFRGRVLCAICGGGEERNGNDFGGKLPYEADGSSMGSRWELLWSYIAPLYSVGAQTRHKSPLLTTSAIRRGLNSYGDTRMDEGEANCPVGSYFNARRNFSATVRRDLMREKYLSLASTSVQGESGVLVFNSISSAAVM